MRYFVTVLHKGWKQILANDAGYLVLAFLALFTIAIIARNVLAPAPRDDTYPVIADAGQEIPAYLTQIQQEQPGLSAVTLNALEAELQVLKTSREDVTSQAYNAYMSGRTHLAFTLLEGAVPNEASGDSVNHITASDAWRQVGALAAPLDRAKAIRAYKSALALAPSRPHLHQELGELYLTGGRADLAEQAFLRVLQTDDDINRPLRAAALGRLGDIEHRRERHEIAKIYYQKSLGEYKASKDTAGMSKILRTLAELAVKSDDPASACDHWQRAANLMATAGDDASFEDIIDSMRRAACTTVD